MHPETFCYGSERTVRCLLGTGTCRTVMEPERMGLAIPEVCTATDDALGAERGVLAMLAAPSVVSVRKKFIENLFGV